MPDLRAGRTVLVTAHGNSLRALVAHLDRLSPEEVLRLNIPTGIPLVYRLDEHLRPTEPGGQYLDPDAAADAIRDELTEAGIAIEDTPSGPRWSLLRTNEGR